MRKVYMNVRGHEKRMAVVENNQLAECLYYRGESEGAVGSIYIGCVTKVLKGMNAAFVDIGLEKMGYLHYNDTLQHGADMNSTIHQGQWLIVGIVKEAVDDKGPKLTQKIELTNEYGVYKPYESFVTMSKQIIDEEKRKSLKQLGKTICEDKDGIIFRSVCKVALLEVIGKEMGELKKRFKEMEGKVASTKKPQLLYGGESYVSQFFKEIAPSSISELVVDDFQTYQEVKKVYDGAKHYRGNEDLFTVHGLRTPLDNGVKRVVWLKNGAYLLIEQTETMTVIDINTGKFVGKANQSDTVYKANIVAVEEIARQLRLRDIGGMILIDFINMKSEDEREGVRRALAEACRNDRSQVRVYGFTMLGILEVTRKRKKKDLASFLSKPCSTCNGRGIVKSTETIVYELERELLSYRHRDEEAVLIQCSGDVVSGIKELITKDILEKECGLLLFFEVQSSPLSFYNVSRFGSVKDFND